MGRTLDVLLGRTTKQTARLKSLLGLATKRVAVVRCCGDVEQLLRLGHPDRALLRAEQVVREQDALDALAMLADYCGILADRAALLDDAHAHAHHHRDCPDELKEAAAGLVYAAARFGDLPELQEVRALLASKFGREFVSSAAELRSGCGINAEIVQKLSTKQPGLGSRQAVLLEIGAEKGIPVRLHNNSCQEPAAGYNSNNHRNRTNNQGDDFTEGDDAVAPAHAAALTFKDVEAAAQAAFESAATAAAAAKAAIDLSRAKPDGPGTPGSATTNDDVQTVHSGGELPWKSRPASVRTNRGV